jgi:iron complex outermembrane receptor protein
MTWRRFPVRAGFLFLTFGLTAASAADPVAGSDDPATAEQPPQESGIVERVVVPAVEARERHDPVSFSTLSSAELEERNRGQDLAMLLSDTPNAFAYSDAGNGIGYSYLRLRGFDPQRIAVYIDGIPWNTPETHQVYFIDLADFAGSLELAQVQRGTGTALYGSPAVGGLVNLDTAHLDTAEGGRIRVGVGSFGTFRADFRYGGPMAGGRWAWMVRAAHVSSDGYRDPSWTRHSLFQLGFERFGSDSVLRIQLFGGPENTQLAFLGIPSSYLHGGVTGNVDHDRRINPLKPGETDTFFQPHLHVIHDRRLRSNLFLKNTAYVILGDGYYRQFAAGVPIEPAGSTEPVLLESAWQKRWIGQTQVGWVPRVSWDHPKGSLQAGAELMLYTGRHKGTYSEGVVCTSSIPGDPCADRAPLPAPVMFYDYTNDKLSVSLFAREVLQPTRSLAVQMELQATRHRFAMRRDEVNGISFDADYGFITPRLGLNWNFSERWNVYASASGAVSEPTFRNVWDPEDPTSNPASRFQRYDPWQNHYSEPIASPEKLRACEIGVGYLHGATRFKANVYRMDFRDEFVFAGGIDNDGNPITDNAGRSLHEGIEIEAAGRLPGEVDLGGYVATSRDELLEYRQILAVSPPDIVNYSGNRIALFPDYTARLRVARAFGPARIAVGARRIGTIYLDNSEDERKDPAKRLEPGYEPKKIDPWTVADLQVTLNLTGWLGGRARSLVLDLQVDNLFDSRYVAFGYAYPNYAGAAIPGYCSTTSCSEFIPGATRGLSLNLIYEF